MRKKGTCYVSTVAPTCSHSRHRWGYGEGDPTNLRTCIHCGAIKIVVTKDDRDSAYLAVISNYTETVYKVSL